MADATLDAQLGAVTELPRPEAPPTPPGASPWGRRLRLLLPPLVMGVLLFGAYAFFSARLPEHRQFLMPSIGDIWTEGLTDSEVVAELRSGLMLTARIAFQGLAISIFVGALLGILMFRFRWLERASYPYLVALQSVPILAITPLLL